MGVKGRLDGEVAIVTGSTAGLGKEVAALFAAEGAEVVVVGRNVEAGQAVVEQVRDANGRATFHAADIGVAADREELVASTVRDFGSVSVLVNNAVSPAAIAADGRVGDIDAALWNEMLGLALVAAAELCRLAIPSMTARGGGSIVNVSAKSAALAKPAQTAYSCAKAGLDALSRCITADYGRDGIRCNTLQPGYIIHERRDVPMGAERRAELEAAQVTRLATARDVAYGALYLASQESAVVSGITLPVDGGSTAVRGRVL